MRGMMFTLALAAGCATTGIPRCPLEGGPVWRALETENFTIYTDASTAKASAVALDLEFVRAALAEFLLPGWFGPEGRIPVVLLDGEGHFAAFFPGVAGAYTEVFMQPVILLAGSANMSQQVIVKHELTHYLVDAFVPTENMPRWLGEGLATYTETMKVDRQNGRVTIGTSADDRVVFALARYKPVRLSGRFNPTLLLFGDGAFYGVSWLKVHYLINVHGPELGAFLARLRDGEPEAAAWDKSFSFPQEKLDELLEAYVTSGQYRVITMRVFASRAPIVERPVADPDVHAWRALLHALRSKLRERAPSAEEQAQIAAEVAEAHRQDPAHARAMAVEALVGKPITVERARRATEVYPDDWMSWMLLSEALKAGGDEKAAWDALKEALRRASANPSIRLKERLLKKGRRSGHS